MFGDFQDPPVHEDVLGKDFLESEVLSYHPFKPSMSTSTENWVDAQKTTRTPNWDKCKTMLGKALKHNVVNFCPRDIRKLKKGFDTVLPADEFGSDEPIYTVRAARAAELLRKVSYKRRNSEDFYYDSKAKLATRKYE